MRLEREELFARIKRLAGAHPEWLRPLDARIAGLQSLHNVLRYADLSLVFITENLADAKWWSVRHPVDLSITELHLEHAAYTQCTKFAIFHLSVSATENVIRALLRAVAPTACNEATAEFKSVYDCLLRTHLQLEDTWVRLLDLVRLVRNTVHNEGVHRPRRRADEAVDYRGTRYVFAAGAPIEFVTWSFVLDRLGELGQLLELAVNTRAVASYDGEIPYEGIEVPAA